MKLFFQQKDIRTYIYDLIPKNEFYWVLSWIKPLALKNLDKCNTSDKDKKIELLKNFFLQHNIYYFITTNPSSFCWDLWNKILVYSKNHHLLQAFEKSFSTIGWFVWKYLWYPQCCIEAHQEETYNFLEAYTCKKYSYRLNEFSNYESVPSRFLLPETNYSLTQKYQYFCWAFLTRTPCSYDCFSSIEKAQKLEEFISRFDQKFYSFILERANKNVIFFDKANWISFSQNLNSERQKIDIFEWVLSNTCYDIFSYWNLYLSIVWDILFLENGLWQKQEFVIWENIYYFEFK